MDDLALLFRPTDDPNVCLSYDPRAISGEEERCDCCRSYNCCGNCGPIDRSNGAVVNGLPFLDRRNPGNGTFFSSSSSAGIGQRDRCRLKREDRH